MIDQRVAIVTGGARDRRATSTALARSGVQVAAGYSRNQPPSTAGWTCSLAARPAGPAAVAAHRGQRLPEGAVGGASGGGLRQQPSVKFGGQSVDLPRDVGVGLQLQLLLLEVVIRLGLLEGRLPILADHDEG
jgi:NAD(P)-dependent dehydrogenase (short-subunit alcohol dehydrogenase family)